jgi:hypothetical protein
MIIDGLDECPAEEATQVLCLIRRLQATLDVRYCVSIRTTAETKLVSAPMLGNFVLLRIPEDNPDIAEYVNTELRDRIESGHLKLGAPTLGLEIRDALIQGANGM